MKNAFFGILYEEYDKALATFNSIKEAQLNSETKIEMPIDQFVFIFICNWPIELTKEDISKFPKDTIVYTGKNLSLFFSEPFLSTMYLPNKE